MTKIGFIGAGQMAKALASGFVANGKIDAGDIVACDPAAAARDAFKSDVAGASAVSEPSDVVAKSDVVFLAVKPQHVDSVFEQVVSGQGGSGQRGSGQAGSGSQTGPLYVSIIAGVPLKRLGEGLKTTRVIRVMPNTPCLVGAGAAGFCLADGATPADAQLVSELLNSVGVAYALPEHLLDAVTGLSGSGPAFVYQVIEAMSDGGVRVGLPRDVATRLAAQTVMGAAKMVLETGEHPGVLKDRVASPGGTTIAGLHTLEAGGLRGTLMNAVVAATERSQALGKGK